MATLSGDDRCTSRSRHQITILIELLLDRGAEIDPTGFSSDSRLGGVGFRPIATALWKHSIWGQKNDYETVQLLLRRGAEYTVTIAAALGDEERVQELLTKDASLCDHQEPGGKRALSAAAETKLREHRQHIT